MNKKTIAIFALSILAAFAFSTAVAYAQTQDFKPLTNLPGVFEKEKTTDPVKVLSGIYGLAIGIGAVIAVIMIIVAGFEYMYQESVSGKSAAKERITNAFLGLGVILASFIILRTINADLVDFNLRLPGGSGRLSTLVDTQKKLDDAIKKLRDAKKTSDELKAEIAMINNRIAEVSNDPNIINEEKAFLVSKLAAERAALAARESTVRNDALAESNIARIENYIAESKKSLTIVLDTERAIQSGLNAYEDKRKSLEAAYEATGDVSYRRAIEENDINRYIFQQKSFQLKQLSEYKERSWFGQWLAADEEGMAESMRKNGEATADRLNSLGKKAEADKFMEETKVRINIICSKCTE